MFRLYLLIIFVLQFAFKSHCQNLEEFDLEYKITYDMRYRIDSTKQKFTKELLHISCNDTVSICRSENKRSWDSTRYQLLFGTVKPTGSRIHPLGQSEENNLIVKKAGKITTFENLSIVNVNDVNYYYEENESDQKWCIEKDTMTIHNYLCQKATLNYGNRQWTAWFTQDIPISNGPYRFSGLPGLIIQVGDKTNSWIFDLHSITKTPHRVSINFEKSIKYQKINKIDFYKQKKDLLDNIVDLGAASSIKVDPSLSARLEKYRNSVKKIRSEDNNWIELYP